MAAKKETIKNTTPSAASSRVAVVLIRGFAKIPYFIEETLDRLHLHRKNVCVIIDNTPAMQGMLLKVKDYIAWGEISEETLLQLVTKRGIVNSTHLMDSKKKYAYSTFDYQGKKYLPYFHLNPPRKGFGRKGIKVAFAAGGALGYRGEKMNDLIVRML